MPKLSKLLALLVLGTGLTLAACDSGDPDDSGDDSPSIGGIYTGTETSEGTTATFSLEIPTTTSGSFTLGDDSEVSVSDGGVTVSFEVTGSGTYDHPDITMNVEFEIDGETYSEQMTGTVSASGDILRFEEDGEVFTLTRE